jgi:hypothetical protein
MEGLVSKGRFYACSLEEGAAADRPNRDKNGFCRRIKDTIKPFLTQDPFDFENRIHPKRL